MVFCRGRLVYNSVGMLRGLIDEWRLKSGSRPDHVALFVESNPDEVREFFVLCDEFGVEKATACVEIEGARVEGKAPVETEEAEAVVSAVADLGVAVASRQGDTDADRSLSFVSGRNELVEAVKGVAESASRGEIEEVDASDIEKRLFITDEPDLVINALGERLGDSMLWQTVYSELCFVDGFDRRSFVGCLREYGERERRFGR